MRRAAVFLLSLALSACGAEAAGPPPAPAATRAAIVTDIHLSGEYLSPTPAPSKPPVPPTPRPTLRSTVGPIFFQTPTPVATGAQDLRNVAADARFNPTQPAATAAAPGEAQVTIGQGPPVLPTATPAPAPPVPTATPITLAAGQSMPLDLPAGAATCDTSQTFRFDYPGDNSMVTVDAQFDGLTPANLGSAGINLWDSSSSTAPVSTATSLTNQKNSVPGSVELTYSRLLSGPVTIELFNWSQTPLTGTLAVVTLASNNAPLQLVGAKSAGAC